MTIISEVARAPVGKRDSIDMVLSGMLALVLTVVSIDAPVVPLTALVRPAVALLGTCLAVAIFRASGGTVGLAAFGARPLHGCRAAALGRGRCTETDGCELVQLVSSRLGDDGRGMLCWRKRAWSLGRRRRPIWRHDCRAWRTWRGSSRCASRWSWLANRGDCMSWDYGTPAGRTVAQMRAQWRGMDPAPGIESREAHDIRSCRTLKPLVDLLEGGARVVAHDAVSHSLSLSCESPRVDDFEVIPQPTVLIPASSSGACWRVAQIDMCSPRGVPDVAVSQ